MISYYASRKKTGTTTVTDPITKAVSEVPVFASDSVGNVITAVYQGEQKDPLDVLLAKRTLPVAYLENLIGKDLSDWVLKGNKIVPSAAKAKENAINNIERNYQNILKKGITVNGITLGAQETDQAAFTKLLTLLQTAEGLQTDTTAFKASQQSIADINGVIHSMTVTQIRTLIVAYGQQIQTLWGNLVTKKIAVSSATTLAELNAINW